MGTLKNNICSTILLLTIFISLSACQWVAVYQGADYENADVVIVMDGYPNNGYIAAGMSWALRTTELGIIDWQYIFNETTYVIKAVANMGDDEAIVAGNHGTYNIRAVKLGPDGIMWQYRIHDDSAIGVTAIAKTGDHGAVIAGYNAGAVSAGGSPWVLKLDSDGI